MTVAHNSTGNTTGYSASSGATSIAPTYPTTIAAGNLLLLVVGMKPSAANGGSVTTPSGWTLVRSITGAGGYGATLGADTGNCNLWLYMKVAAGTETGTLTVTIATSDVAYGKILRYTKTAANWRINASTGSKTAAGGSLSITGDVCTGISSGDEVLGIFVQPTDVSTPGQFSAEAFTATGATIGTAVEIEEQDSSVGNQVGGFIARAAASAGTTLTAATMTATAGGTTTNVRGPGMIVRIGEYANITPATLKGPYDYTGSDGTAWTTYSADWANAQTPGGYAIDLLTNQGRILQGGLSNTSAYLSGFTAEDVVVKYKIRFPNGDNVFPQFWFRAPNTLFDSYGGVAVELAYAGGGSGNFYDQYNYGGYITMYQPTGLALTSTDTYNVVAGVIGNDAKFKFWREGDTEPSAWNFEGKFFRSAGAGYAGFRSGPGSTSGAVFIVDDVSVYNYFPAPPNAPATVACTAAVPAAVVPLGGTTVAATAAVPYATAVGSAAKVSTFTDDFATADGAKWTGYGANPTVTGGRQAFTPDPGYSSVLSAAQWDLTASACVVELVQPPNVGNGTTQAWPMQLRLSNLDLVQWIWANGQLIADYVVNGGGTTVATLTYSNITHRWLRIREAAGTVYWDYSADGVSWTNAASQVIAWNKTALTLYAAAGYYGTEPTPGVMLLDNLNLPPAGSPAPASVAGVAAVPSVTVRAVAPPSAVACTVAVPAVDVRSAAAGSAVSCVVAVPAPRLAQAVSQVACAVAVPSPVVAVGAAAVTVACTGAVPTVGLASAAGADTVAAVVAVPGPVVAAGAGPVAAVACVVAVPTPRTGVPVGVVACTVAVPAASPPIVFPQPSQVACTVAVPAPAGMGPAGSAVAACVAAVPSVTVAVVVGGSTVAGLVAVPPPVVRSVVAAPAAAAVVAVPAPLLEQNPNPSTVAASVAVGAVSVVATSVVAALACVVGVPAPVVGVAAGADTVGVVVAVPGVQLHQQDPRPTVVACLVVVPAATASGSSGAAVGALTVACVVAVPPPTGAVTGGPPVVACVVTIAGPVFATGRPGTVAAVVSVLAPTVAGRSTAGSVVGVQRPGPRVSGRARPSGRMVGASRRS